MSKSKKTRQLVRISRTHIKKGKRTSNCDCPVALALSAAGLIGPSVYPDVLYFDHPDSFDRPGNYKRVRFEPSRAVVRFIDKFDIGKPVRPFNFYVTY